MRSYFFTIPLALVIAVAFWWSLIDSLNTNTFDSWFAWVMGGLAANGALIGIVYHCYRTYTGTWKR